jgi:anti-sigma regulatory factor (Ser/Thr protein kinase)
MTPAMPGDHIVIGNDVSELRRMTRWLWVSAAEADISHDLVHTLDVVANEAVANIIDYAYEDKGRHDISLELTKTSSGATLVIRDDGKPFNLLEVPEHKIPAGIDDATIGGLGVHLIRRLTTRCEYRREDHFNVLLLEAKHTNQTANA